MKILLFVAAGVLAAAPAIRVVPEVLTSCRNGLAQASITWNSEGVSPVFVYVGEAPMTGPEAMTGTARTGEWVTDGMPFTLRNATGQTLASTRAAVQCDAASWWPLQVGNEWHFRLNSRSITGSHAVWRVTGTEDVNGTTWYRLDPGPAGVSRVRSAADGKIYSLAADGTERLLLDPSGTEASFWRPGGRSAVAVTLAGTFGEELSWTGPIAGLGQESGRLVRGVGPSYYQSNVIAGSSGGFGQGLTLLEAVIGGARFAPAYPGFELVLESKSVNLSTKSARNCAIPCYFVACFGADPAGTYKPCMEAAVRGGSGRLALVDPSGRTVFETPANGWVRIPLYQNPATPLPPGNYTVSATGSGGTVALPLAIE